MAASLSTNKRGMLPQLSLCAEYDLKITTIPVVTLNKPEGLPQTHQKGDFYVHYSKTLVVFQKLEKHVIDPGLWRLMWFPSSISFPHGAAVVLQGGTE